MQFLKRQFNSIWSRKDLLSYLTRSELKLRYKNKGLGVLWAILDPLMMMVVYIVLVKVIFQRGGPQYPVLLFAALLSWRWFIQSVLSSVKIITGNANLIQTINFPVSILPLSKVLVNMVNYFAGFIILIPILIYFDAIVNRNLLWLPLIIFLQFIFTLGVSLIVSIIGIYFRDLQNILEFSVRIIFYLSPALYSLSLIPQQYYVAYLVANPFASLFNSYKNVLVRGEPPNDYLLLFGLYGILLLILGLFLFDRKKRTFAKIL